MAALHAARRRIRDLQIAARDAKKGLKPAACLPDRCRTAPKSSPEMPLPAIMSSFHRRKKTGLLCFLQIVCAFQPSLTFSSNRRMLKSPSLDKADGNRTSFTLQDLLDKQLWVHLDNKMSDFHGL